MRGFEVRKGRELCSPIIKKLNNLKKSRDGKIEI